MCGLAGFHRRNGKPIYRADRLAAELLMEIETRGRDAAGELVLYDNCKGRLQRLAEPATEFLKLRHPFQGSPRTVLLHTRFATSGNKASARDAHPIPSGFLVATHNGHIINADQLFLKFNLPRLATVDSEVIPAIVSRFGWAKAEEALSLLVGGAATALIDTRQPREVILARLATYPMVYGITEDVVVWASTIQAISRAWSETYGKPFLGTFTILEDGDVVRITSDGIVKRKVSLQRCLTNLKNLNNQHWSSFGTWDQDGNFWRNPNPKPAPWGRITTHSRK